MAEQLLIRGGLVYDHNGDVHRPAQADILIEGDTISAVGAALNPAAGTRILDATNRLVMPGLVNAHYHSHDVLCRGLFEELPLEMWLLYTLPLGANRSKEEVRARTLVGALESLRAGITTVQDMLGLAPFAEDYLDVVLGAYRDAGIRVVFSPMVSDIPAIGMVGNADRLPPEVREMLGTRALPIAEQLDFLAAQFRRHPAEGTLHWAVAPFAPQRCTPTMLQGCAALAEAHDLPIYTHVYETRGQALIARDAYGAYGGSFIEYLARMGVLGPRLNIVHSVWITRAEMDRLAAADTGVVLNALSNMKLKSGVAPICDLREAGVRLGLGCDNCSDSDVQNMFQSMKLFCLFAAVSEPEPGPPLAHEALRHATLGNARTAGLGNVLGAVRPGFKADLVLIDLDDLAYLPLNSAARQLVYTETGRGIDTVIVGGRIVVADRAIKTIDMEALRREVAGLMKHFLADYDRIATSRRGALPHLLDLHRQAWRRDLPMRRFLDRTR
jgi:cytosine/adenosine deaminase-related metal-dependent hydrolase